MTAGLVLGLGLAATAPAVSARVAVADSYTTTTPACGQPEFPTATPAWGSGTWLVPGGGVTAFSNGPALEGTGTPCTAATTTVSGQTTGAEYQCVEFINRLYLTRGWITTPWTVDAGTPMFDAPMSLSKQGPGQVTYLGPGDIVEINVTGPNVSEGHALIVNSASPVTRGMVDLVSQNSGEAEHGSVASNSEPIVPGTLTDGSVVVGGSGGGYTYTFVGVIHAPATPSPPAVATPASAAQAIYKTLPTASVGSWATSGVVSHNGVLWLTTDVQRDGDPPTTRATIYKWQGEAWKAQAAVALVAGVLEGNPDTYDAVTTAPLTGSADPDFLIHSVGAGTRYLAVLADNRRKWVAVPFVDSRGTAPFTSITGTPHTTVTVAFDSCYPNCAQARNTTWQMRYSAGRFIPVASRSACGGESLALAAHAYAVAHHYSSDQERALYAWACADGYAIAAATNFEDGIMLALRLENRAWKLIAADNIIPPGVLPAATYRKLHAAVLKEAIQGWFPY